MGDAMPALLRKEAREQYRTYRLWVALALFLVFAITAPLITKNLPSLVPKTEQFEIIMQQPTAADAAAQYFGYIVQMGALLVILLAMDSIAGERSRGLLPMVLSKPVRRRELLACKLMVHGAALIASLALATAVFYACTVWLFEYFPPGGAALSIIPTAVLICFVLSLTVFWSVIAGSSAAAGGLAFLSFLLLTLPPGFLSAIKRFGPSYLAEAARAIALSEAGLAEALPSMLVAAALIVALIWASAYLFERRDI